MTETELLEVLRKLRYDLTAAQAKVTKALDIVEALNIQPQVSTKGATFSCSCGRVFLHERDLLLHKQNVHDGAQVPMSELELKA